MRALRLVLGIVFGVCGLLILFAITREKPASEPRKPKRSHNVARWQQSVKDLFPPIKNFSDDQPMTFHDFLKSFDDFVVPVETHSFDLSDPIELIGQRAGKSSFAAMEIQELMQ